MSMKNPNNTIGNQTRNLPACSAVPKPTAPPRAPYVKKNWSEVAFMSISKFIRIKLI